MTFKFWFDFTNPPHVNFFLPLIRHFYNHEYSLSFTARDFVETTKLLELNELPYKLVGKHGGENKFLKAKELINRNLLLYLNSVNFDLSFSSNYNAPLVSWLKRKPALVFDDNDISPNWLYSKFADYVISPEAIDKEAMFKMGVPQQKLITYKGFKENIYIADFKPDHSFLKKIPFKEFVVVRPENLKASYIQHGEESIVQSLIEKLIFHGINVLYLPRYDSDISLVGKNKKLYIPDSVLNGLDVCFFASAVLTGAGTFSREAAIIGTPAISFFAGKRFLGVDKKMFSKKLVYFSRNVDDIVKYVITSNKKAFDQQISVDIQQEFFFIVEKLVNKLVK